MYTLEYTRRMRMCALRIRCETHDACALHNKCARDAKSKLTLETGSQSLIPNPNMYIPLHETRNIKRSDVQHKKKTPVDNNMLIG